MDSRSRTWLQKNHSILLSANGCVDKLLDDLITAGIFYIIDDDYQEISVKETRVGRLRKLLEYLPLKRSEALTAFKKAISKHCPHVLERCRVEPKPSKSRMRQLSELLTATYRTRKFSVIPAIPCLGANGEVEVCSFFRDLMVIGRHELARKRSGVDQASTSADEHPTRRNRCADEQWDATLSSNIFCQRHRHAASATDHDPSIDVVVTVGQDVHRCSGPCTHRNVALWAGAGCGKTGLCLNIAHLFSFDQLWSFFGAVLLLRLREPAIQEAMTLPDLLRVLLPDVSQEELQEFAQDLLRRNGEGLLAVLDGVDELVEKDGSFVVRLLNGDVLSKACLLATSRPCRAAKKFLDTSVFHANVELLGFSENQVGVFISERLDRETGAKLMKVLDENAGVASLMSIPLLALLVCEVFKNTGDHLLSTKTKLFSALVILVIRHAVSEKRLLVSELEEERLGAVEDVDKFPEGVVKELLFDVAKIACIAHDKKMSIFDLSFIVEEAKCKSLDFLKLGLLAVDEMKKGLLSMRLFSFRHLTIHEFLTALFLSYKISVKPSDLKQILTDLCKDASSHVVLSFLAGLLKKEHHSFFFRHLNKWLHDPCLDDDGSHDDNGDRDSSGSDGSSNASGCDDNGEEDSKGKDSEDEDSDGADGDGGNGDSDGGGDNDDMYNDDDSDDDDGDDDDGDDDDGDDDDDDDDDDGDDDDDDDNGGDDNDGDDDDGDDDDDDDDDGDDDDGDDDGGDDGDGDDDGGDDDDGDDDDGDDDDGDDDGNDDDEGDDDGGDDDDGDGDDGNDDDDDDDSEDEDGVDGYFDDDGGDDDNDGDGDGDDGDIDGDDGDGGASISSGDVAGDSSDDDDSDGDSVGNCIDDEAEEDDDGEYVEGDSDTNEDAYDGTVDESSEDDGDIRNERLRVCFQCAQEASGGDANAFPDQLKLPEVVVLYQVTAADLTMLSSAIRKSSTIKELVLHFDETRKESDAKKSSRTQNQTRSAMTALTAAIGQNRSLRTMEVCGPKYKLMERKSLANLVSNSRLVELRVWHCGVGDTEVLELSGVLQHNTKLFWLDLRGNAIGDVGMNALADALTSPGARKTKLAILELTDNPYSMETGARLKRRLTRIGDLYV